MRLLGHKSISNTLIYTQMVQFKNDEYQSATSHTIEEAQQLIEAGFEYVTELDGVKIFRKRKSTNILCLMMAFLEVDQ